MAELYEKCLRVGLRMTLPRKIILEVIEAADDHPDVDEMYRRAVEKDRSISIATVYRTIKLFEEAGIIEKLDIGDGRSRYEEAGEQHEHLIDVESGEIIEFQNEELEEMKRQVALNMGYVLGLATLEDDIEPVSKWNHSGLFMSLNYDIPGM